MQLRAGFELNMFKGWWHQEVFLPNPDFLFMYADALLGSGFGESIHLDWDSQSLYTAAILENGGPNRGTENKKAKKVSGSSWNSTTTEHAHLSNLPNNDSDLFVSK